MVKTSSRSIGWRIVALLLVLTVIATAVSTTDWIHRTADSLCLLIAQNNWLAILFSGLSITVGASMCTASHDFDIRYRGPARQPKSEDSTMELFAMQVLAMVTFMSLILNLVLYWVTSQIPYNALMFAFCIISLIVAFFASFVAALLLKSIHKFKLSQG